MGTDRELISKKKYRVIQILATEMMMTPAGIDLKLSVAKRLEGHEFEAAIYCSSGGKFNTIHLDNDLLALVNHGFQLALECLQLYSSTSSISCRTRVNLA